MAERYLNIMCACVRESSNPRQIERQSEVWWTENAPMVSILNSQKVTMLPQYGKGDLAEVIKLSFEMGRLSQITQIDPKCQKCAYKREAGM